MFAAIKKVQKCGHIFSKCFDELHSRYQKMKCDSHKSSLQVNYQITLSELGISDCNKAT